MTAKPLMQNTPEDFVAYFVDNNLRPVRYHTRVYNGKCCGLGALATALGVPVDQDRDNFATSIGATDKEEWDFTGGFDWGLCHATPPQIKEQRPAWILGFKVARAVQHLKDPEDPR